MGGNASTVSKLDKLPVQKQHDNNANSDGLVTLAADLRRWAYKG
jgi:hypothetical protein